MAIDYDTRQRIRDLLDLFREEVSCKTYNGWVRRRQPDDIRKDLDAEIERLTATAVPDNDHAGASAPDNDHARATAPDVVGALRRELVDLVRAAVAVHKEHGTVLTVHMNNMADLLDELDAATPKET